MTHTFKELDETIAAEFVEYCRNLTAELSSEQIHYFEQLLCEYLDLRYKYNHKGIRVEQAEFDSVVIPVFEKAEQKGIKSLLLTALLKYINLPPQEKEEKKRRGRPPLNGDKRDVRTELKSTTQEKNRLLSILKAYNAYHSVDLSMFDFYLKLAEAEVEREGIEVGEE